ncbi:MAG: RdgB/HAM1 family non-canonical purine NTP pyrophosphatase [Gammaproteobacteria bacterium]|nr:MAG: RdgB/HAM1 family non-canonical purine NTP pyrophosphatase [Gammaproteobacteria bacterium]
MSRLRLVLATGNPGKARELAPLLAPLGVELLAQGELGVAGGPEEGAPTYVENALLKARHAARLTGLPALADDSGLEVDALGGAPGVRSARFAGPGATDADNNRRLLEALAGVPAAGRTARFRCLLALLPGPEHPAPLLCEGVWEGRILEAPRGAGGFGYDPLFLDPELGRSAAELAPEEKARRSHRGRALACLRARLPRYLERYLERELREGRG